MPDNSSYYFSKIEGYFLFQLESGVITESDYEREMDLVELMPLSERKALWIRLQVKIRRKQHEKE